MIEVEELAIVGVACRWSLIEEGPAQEFVLDLTRSLAGRYAVCLRRKDKFDEFKKREGILSLDFS